MKIGDIRTSNGSLRHAAQIFLIWSLFVPFIAAQSTGTLEGHVTDPNGSMVSGAVVTLTGGGITLRTHSSEDGTYTFQRVPVGTYTLEMGLRGFALFSTTHLSITAGVIRTLDVSLKIAVQRQDVQVNDHDANVSVDPNENASAMVLKDSDLDALSDDPDELQNELQALGGPSAGPSGGEIYVDGFTGGQIPPKSSIREIRVNQNPFSAEFDRLGYGRVEILTKPGSGKVAGQLTSFGSDSAWNTANPLVPQHPSYYFNLIDANVSGPISNYASYFFNVSHFVRQNQSIIDAINPGNTEVVIRETLPNPSSLWSVNPRWDLQLGKNNTISVRDSFNRSVATGNGPGQLSLSEQAFNTNDVENALQVSDTTVVNAHLLNETRFQWRRIRNDQSPAYYLPTVTVEGAFTSGGSNSGVVQDHQDIVELQNYSTLSVGKHTSRLGIRVRADRDANYSTSGRNGNYFFDSVDQYVAASPAEYQETIINNPLARILLFDGALFYQDDWGVRPNLNFSYGLRFEAQNRIHDRGDWAPRFSLAWAPEHFGKRPPRTVVRLGYGWFYNRFTVPNSFRSLDGTPYLTQTIHLNGRNEVNYVLQNPAFYNPESTVSPIEVISSEGSIPSSYSIAGKFHAALDMQSGIGIDRRIGKAITLNTTYLFTRGVHQYLTNNVTAPKFNSSEYVVTGPLPDAYNYQYESVGVYSQHEIISMVAARLRHLSLHGYYVFNRARSDTQGVDYVPSEAQDPGLDYGRALFGITSRLSLIGAYTAPHGFVIAPLIAAQSGTPYNVVVGSDLTENNQFNARPTYGTCGATGVVSSDYGCLDTDPIGKGEKIVPYDLGTGPANVVMHLRISKVIGIGPRIRGESGYAEAQGNGGRGLSAVQVQPKLDATVPRKYSLTIIGGALNVFNIVNLGAPNGTLKSPLFGASQSLATGQFGSPTPGNRTILAQIVFTF